MGRVVEEGSRRVCRVIILVDIVSVIRPGLAFLGELSICLLLSPPLAGPVEVNEMSARRYLLVEMWFGCK